MQGSSNAIVPKNYFIPCFNVTVRKSTLCAYRCLLALIGVLSSIGFLIARICQYDLPLWSYCVEGGFLGFLLLKLGVSFLLKPEQTISSENKALLPVLESHEESESLSPLVHELCELSVDGSDKPCSHERIKEIVDSLDESKRQRLLNTVPQWFLDARKPFFRLAPQCYTPFHYWASQGDLKNVRLLFEAGASDYPTNGPPAMRSALYQAALFGHLDVVNYLLENKALANIAFNQNVLRYFIPDLVYRMYQALQLNSLKEKALECLECILKHLQTIDLENLALQLQIPVNDREENCIQFIKKWYKDKNSLGGRLSSLLQQYGDEKAVSVADLKKRDLYKGSGCTLDVEASEK